MNLPPSLLWENKELCISAFFSAIFLSWFSGSCLWDFLCPAHHLGCSPSYGFLRMVNTDGIFVVVFLVIHPTGIVSLLGVIHSWKWIDDHLPILGQFTNELWPWHHGIMAHGTPYLSEFPMDSTMAPITPTALHNSNRNDQLLPFRLAERWSIRFWDESISNVSKLFAFNPHGAQSIPDNPTDQLSIPSFATHVGLPDRTQWKINDQPDTWLVESRINMDQWVEG